MPFSVVASIMGWSAGTTVRMLKRYGHISDAALDLLQHFQRNEWGKPTIRTAEWFWKIILAAPDLSIADRFKAVLTVR